MKNKLVKIFIFVFACLFAALCAPTAAFAEQSDIAASVRNLYKSVEGVSRQIGVQFYKTYFGSSDIALQIEVYGDFAKDDSAVLQAFAAIDRFVSEVDEVATTHAGESGAQAEKSDVFRFNAASFGQKVAVSEHTANMIALAKTMHEATSGAYDPTSYRLVDLWGFSSRTYGKNGNLPYDRVWQSQRVSSGGVSYTDFFLPLPEEKYVAAFKKLCNFDSVLLEREDDGYFLIKNCPDVVVDGVAYSQWLDLGGVAKGYVVDEVRRLLDSFGMRFNYVNCGASSIAFSSYEQGESIVVGLQNPNSLFSAYAKLSLKDVNMSTSGQYIRKYTVDGVRYSHIVDPRTGRPIETGVDEITVIGGLSAAEADCWTTALCVVGKDGIMQKINSDFGKSYSVCAVLSDGGNQKIVSNIDKEAFDYVDDSFAWAVKSVEKDGETVFVWDGSAKSASQTKKTVVIVVVAVCAALLVGYLVVRLARSRKVSARQVVANVKKEKFFRKADVVVYSSVALILVLLFSVFVFWRSGGDVNQINVEDMLGERLMSYDVKTASCVVYPNENYDVKVEQSSQDGVFTVVATVTTKEGGYNVLTIVRDGTNVSAKMTDADCGLHKECVNYFGAITSPDGVIVCQPHGIKVTAGEEVDYVLV